MQRQACPGVFCILLAGRSTVNTFIGILDTSIAGGSELALRFNFALTESIRDDGGLACGGVLAI